MAWLDERVAAVREFGHALRKAPWWWDRLSEQLDR